MSEAIARAGQLKWQQSEQEQSTQPRRTKTRSVTEPGGSPPRGSQITAVINSSADSNAKICTAVTRRRAAASLYSLAWSSLCRVGWTLLINHPAPSPNDSKPASKHTSSSWQQGCYFYSPSSHGTVLGPWYEAKANFSSTKSAALINAVCFK